MRMARFAHEDQRAERGDRVDRQLEVENQRQL
jgi:hypothetical protein